MTWLAALVLGFAAQDSDTIQDLIRKLGSDDFATREQATAELRKAGKAAREALQKVARESQDPEVRQRARSLLEESAPGDAPPPRKSNPRPPAGPLRPGAPGFSGTSVTVVTNNGDSTYRITPGDGSPVLVFHKAAQGPVKLDYQDENGESKVAESPTLAQFLTDHKELAEKFGVTEEGISYGGGRVSFRGNFIPRFGPPRLPPIPRPAPPAPPPPAPAEGEEGVLAAGATLTPVDDAMRAQLEIPEGQGVVVTDVASGSAADQLGLRKNDVLLELDGKKVTSCDSVKDGIRKDGSAVVLRKGQRVPVGRKKDF